MAASASTPAKSLFSQPETLIGKFISVLFQSNVRYEGICHSIDTQSNPPTITLAYVKDCGTEGRGTNRGGFEVPPKGYLVEHMIFLTNKIVRMKILAAPDWNMLDTNNLSAEEIGKVLSSSRATEGEKSDSNHSNSSDKEKEDKQGDTIEGEQGADDHHPIPSLNLMDKGKGKMSYEDELSEKESQEGCSLDSKDC